MVWFQRKNGHWRCVECVAARRGCKRLDTSTQGEYTKSKPAFENVKNFNVSKKELQILPLRPAFFTIEAVTGNDMGNETVARRKQFAPIDRWRSRVEP